MEPQFQPAPEVCESPPPVQAEMLESQPPPCEMGQGFFDPSCDPDGAMLAFAHYAEDVDGQPLSHSPTAADKLALLAGDEQAQAITDMSAEEFEELVDQVPNSEQANLESLINNCSDPARKLELWRNYHTTMNNRDLEKHSPESEIGEDPDKQGERVRREQILRDTETESADDIAALEASGQPLTLEQVDALIARKELEHQIEMRHNINLTNSGETRADGTRVVWSEEELRVLEGSLAQVPEETLSDPAVVTKIHRGLRDAEGNNATNDPNGGIISLYDNGANLRKDSKREAGDDMADEHTTFMEHVMLHEIGHSAHNQDIAKHGGVYGDAVKHIDGAQWGEYFAQDYKNALLNPETHAKESLDKPQAELAAAEAALQANPGDPALQAAHAAAAQKAKSWETMYSHMRNEVFDADAAEDDRAARLEEVGAGPEEVAEFRARAARLSTPDQIERLAGEYGI